jgi:hypothetical protein
VRCTFTPLQIDSLQFVFKKKNKKNQPTHTCGAHCREIISKDTNASHKAQLTTYPKLASPAAEMDKRQRGPRGAPFGQSSVSFRWGIFWGEPPSHACTQIPTVDRLSLSLWSIGADCAHANYHIKTFSQMKKTSLVHTSRIKKNTETFLRWVLCWLTVRK